MDPVSLLAIGVVAFVLAAVVAWKITRFFLKAFLWVLALAILAAAIWWFIRQRSTRPPDTVAHRCPVLQATPVPSPGPAVAA